MNTALLPCFNCQKQGHWTVNCPESPSKKFQSPDRNNVQEHIPDKDCPCGAGTCAVLTSNTRRNPGRKFYKCPLFKSPELKCAFFEWCDERTSNKKQPSNPECPCAAGTCVRHTVKKEGVNKGRQFFACPEQGASKCKFFHWCDVEMSPQKCGVRNLFSPDCSCGAGKCRRLTFTENGENKGRGYFVCPVKKGQGACNFFQWEDDARHEPSVDHLGEREPFASSEKTNPYPVIDVDDDDDDGDASSDEKQSESPSSVGCEVKEMLVIDVDADDDALPIRMHDVSLIENKRAGSCTKPGNCFSCGREGHWMKDCIKTNSVCVKCGKFGHWKKDCTA